MFVLATGSNGEHPAAPGVHFYTDPAECWEHFWRCVCKDIAVTVRKPTSTDRAQYHPYMCLVRVQNLAQIHCEYFADLVDHTLHINGEW